MSDKENTTNNSEQILQKKSNGARKILIFSLDYLPGTISGAESAIEDITDRIDPSEIEFHMVTMHYDSNVPRVQQFKNVTCHYVGLFGKPDATLEERKQFPLHYNKHYFQLAAGIKGWLLHRKHHYDGAWAMMAHGTGVPVSVFNILTGVPYALSLQEGDPPEYIEATMKPLWKLFKRSFTHATVVQPISKFLGDWARRMGYKGEMPIIPDGANPQSIHPTFDQSEVDAIKEKYGKKEGDIWLTNTARLVHQKGWETTVEAMLHLPEHIKLMIVGGGPDEQKLTDLVEEKGLERRVFFTGQVDRSEVSKYRFAADIFVGPSRSEGLGHAFLSAMACKLPVVATQVGGIQDFLFDAKRNPEKGTTGWAVDSNEPMQIVEAVNAILADPEKTKEVVERAHKMVLEKYDWDVITEKMKKEVFEPLWITADPGEYSTVNRTIETVRSVDETIPVNQNSEDLVERATAIATRAHEGQVRKSDGTPYITHPLAVGEILREAGFSDVVIAAGIAHDILEDTDVSEEALREELGDEVVDIVCGVSEDKSLEWEARKEKYIETVANAPVEVKAVSVADKIHNAMSFIEAHAEQGPVVWEKFRRGKEMSNWFQRSLLEEIKKTWEHPMLKKLDALVTQLEELDQ